MTWQDLCSDYLDHYCSLKPRGLKTINCCMTGWIFVVVLDNYVDILLVALAWAKYKPTVTSPTSLWAIQAWHYSRHHLGFHYHSYSTGRSWGRCSDWMWLRGRGHAAVVVDLFSILLWTGYYIIYNINSVFYWRSLETSDWNNKLSKKLFNKK